jgi:hypothetical protein
MKPKRRSSQVSPSGRRASRPATTSLSGAAPSPSGVASSNESIARRAYLKWKARGCPAGTHLQDWFKAEAELKADLGHGTRG